MIKIDDLKEEDKGRSVIYVSFDSREDGLITSWNDTFIFVDYGKNCGRGTATSPSDLEWAFG